MRLRFWWYPNFGYPPHWETAEELVLRHLSPLLKLAELGPAIEWMLIEFEWYPPKYRADKDGALRIIDRVRIKQGIDLSFSAHKIFLLPCEDVKDLSVRDFARFLFQKLKEFANALLKFRRKIDFDRQGFKDLILLAEHEYLKEAAVTPQSRSPEGA